MDGQLSPQERLRLAAEEARHLLGHSQASSYSSSSRQTEGASDLRSLADQARTIMAQGAPEAEQVEPLPTGVLGLAAGNAMDRAMRLGRGAVSGALGAGEGALSLAARATELEPQNLAVAPYNILAKKFGLPVAPSLSVSGRVIAAADRALGNPEADVNNPEGLPLSRYVFVPAAKAVGDLAKSLSTSRETPEGITDYARRGDVAGTIDKYAGLVAENAPMFLSQLAGVAAGVSEARILGAMGAVSAGQKLGEVRDRKDMSESDKNFDALMNGAAEVVFEKFGSLPWMKKALATPEARTAAKELVKKGLLSRALAAAKNVAGQPIVSEVAGEEATQVAQNAADIVSGNRTEGVTPMQQLGSGIVETGLVAGALAGPSQIVSMSSRPPRISEEDSRMRHDAKTAAASMHFARSEDQSAVAGLSAAPPKDQEAGAPAAGEQAPGTAPAPEYTQMEAKTWRGRVAQKGAELLGYEPVFVMPNTPEADVFGGRIEGNRVFLNVMSEDPLLTVIWHEFSHHLDDVDPTTSQAVRSTILGARKDSWTAYRDRLVKLAEKRGRKLDEAMIESEFIADSMSGLASVPEWYTQLATENAPVAQKLADHVGRFLTRVIERFNAAGLRNTFAGHKDAVSYIDSVDKVRSEVAKLVGKSVETRLAQKNAPQKSGKLKPPATGPVRQTAVPQAGARAVVAATPASIQGLVRPELAPAPVSAEAQAATAREAARMTAVRRETDIVRTSAREKVTPSSVHGIRPGASEESPVVSGETLTGYEKLRQEAARKEAERYPGPEALIRQEQERLARAEALIRQEQERLARAEALAKQSETQGAKRDRRAVAAEPVATVESIRDRIHREYPDAGRAIAAMTPQELADVHTGKRELRDVMAEAEARVPSVVEAPSPENERMTRREKMQAARAFARVAEPELKVETPKSTALVVPDKVLKAAVFRAARSMGGTATKAQVDTVANAAARRATALGLGHSSAVRAVWDATGYGTKDLGAFVKAVESALETEKARRLVARESLQPVTPEQDAEYMAAVEDARKTGVWDRVQKMVDAAAKAAGYTVGPVWHGTTATRHVSGKQTPGNAEAKRALREMAERHGIGDWTSVASILERWVASGEAGKYGATKADAQRARQLADAARGSTQPGVDVMSFSTFAFPDADYELGVHVGTEQQAAARGTPFPFFIRVQRPLRLPDLGTWNYQSVMRKARKVGVPISEAEYTAVFSARDSNDALRRLLGAKGYDSVVYENEAEGNGDSYIVFSPDQIKSAEPVTSDDAGNVIPLSKRFDSNQNDVRYSLQATPEEFRKLVTAPGGVGTVRPDLSNPLRTEEGRKALAAVDVLRGTPVDPAGAKKADAEARAMILQRGPTAILDDILAGRLNVNESPTNTQAGLMAMDAAAQQALSSGDLNDISRVMLANFQYRDAGSLVSALMRARKGRRGLLGAVAGADPAMARASVMAALTHLDRKQAEKLALGNTSVAGEAFKDFRAVREKLLKNGIDIERLTSEQLTDPATVARIIREVQTQRATVGDKMWEWYVNWGLLSGLKTHAANFLGNGLFALTDLVATRFVEAAINSVAHAERGATFSEFRHMMEAVGPGIRAGLRSAAYAWENEVSPSADVFTQLTDKLSDTRRGPAISGGFGRFARVPGRGLLWADELAKGVVRSAEGVAMAHRLAREKKLTGEAEKKFIETELSSPNTVSSVYANNRALELSFQTPSDFVNWVNQGTNRNIVTKWLGRALVPFRLAPWNIARTTLRKSPLGVVNTAYGLATGKYKDNGAKLQYHVAENLLAAGTMMVLWSMLKGDDDRDGRPLVTGSKASYRDPVSGQENLYPPMSFRAGDEWVGYGRAEPLAGSFAMAVDAVKGLRDYQGGADPSKLKDKAWNSVLSLVRDKTFLQALGEIVRISEDPGSFGTRLTKMGAQMTAATAVPAIARHAIQAGDDAVRDNRPYGSGTEYLRSIPTNMIPAAAGFPVSEQRVEPFGRGVTKGDENLGALSSLLRFASPVPVRDVRRQTPAETLLARWNRANPGREYWPRPPERTITARDGRSVELDRKTYAEYSKRAGKLATQTVESLIARGYIRPDQPTPRDIETVRKAFARARKRARIELGLYSRESEE